MSGIMPMINVPDAVQYGRVQAHLVAFIADTKNDGDQIPDEIPLEGVVVLTPTVGAVRFPTTAPPRTAVVQALRCPIIGGDLYPPDTVVGALPAQPGVVVVASDQPAGLPDTVQWTATFELVGARVQPGSITFEVPANGVVDLTTVLPSTPAPGTVVVVSTVDRERAEAAAVRAEQIVADLEGWEPGGGGGSSSWTAITGKPSVIAAGESVVEARAVIGAVSVEDLPDVSVFATKTELTSGLAGKQPVGDYATTAALTEGLAGKQPVGDYALVSQLPDVSGLATKTALTEGLATKQPVGDYATTTALTSGLATKQPVGDYATRAELPDVSGFATTAYVDQMVGDIDTALSGILEGE